MILQKLLKRFCNFLKTQTNNFMRFPYIPSPAHKGQGVLMPFLPLTLNHNAHSIKTHAMLDTGSMVNVLPFSIGISLGLSWESQSVPVELGGNLKAYEAYGILINATIESYPTVRLAFAWTQADNIPLLLGQTNIFMEFDVLFSRSASFFDIYPKGKALGNM